MKARKKLFIQIPCLNEEATIGRVIQDIPKKELEGWGLSVKVLVIDDNSSDKTGFLARKSGADFIIKHKTTLGLAKSFKEGLDFCLTKGADIIVNTDGDNQYNQKEIVKLVRPVLSGRADMVIGDRQVSKLEFMPWSKKTGNIAGSWIIRLLTGKSVSDASSGFRAMNAKLVKAFNLQSAHTYTHESIIQAANLDAVILSIPVEFRRRNSGNSRLISKGVFDHMKKSIATIIRSILLYKALKYLLMAGAVFTAVGIVVGLRFLYFFLKGDGNGHIQSLILSSMLINLGFMTLILGFIADLISVNRKIIEEIKLKLK